MARPSLREAAKLAQVRSFKDLKGDEKKSLKQVGVTSPKFKELQAGYAERSMDPTKWLGVLRFFQELQADRKLVKPVRDLCGIDARALRSFKHLTSIEDEDFDRWAASGLSLSMLRLLGIAWSRTKTGDERGQKRQTHIRELADRAVAEGWTVRELERKLHPHKKRKAEKERDLQVCFSTLASLLADLEGSAGSSKRKSPKNKSPLNDVAKEYKRDWGRNPKLLSEDQREVLAAAVLKVAELQPTGNLGKSRRK
ncbi:hypothetical protein [Candidatus Laterigemmans baculatus]|uniref:hypothetical protein n=1 Tax=Candidatus Laterigemmans baculatus TaxID=2770505 RepID=UPI0013DCFAC5|nr:hypothetical protein [Candidatus Laterigemmans baculatus]